MTVCSPFNGEQCIFRAPGLWYRADTSGQVLALPPCHADNGSFCVHPGRGGARIRVRLCLPCAAMGKKSKARGAVSGRQSLARTAGDAGGAAHAAGRPAGGAGAATVGAHLAKASTVALHTHALDEGAGTSPRTPLSLAPPMVHRQEQPKSARKNVASKKVCNAGSATALVALAEARHAAVWAAHMATFQPSVTDPKNPAHADSLARCCRRILQEFVYTSKQAITGAPFDSSEASTPEMEGLFRVQRAIDTMAWLEHGPNKNGWQRPVDGPETALVRVGALHDDRPGALAPWKSAIMLTALQVMGFATAKTVMKTNNALNPRPVEFSFGSSKARLRTQWHLFVCAMLYHFEAFGPVSCAWRPLRVCISLCVCAGTASAAASCTAATATPAGSCTLCHADSLKM